MELGTYTLVTKKIWTPALTLYREWWTLPKETGQSATEWKLLLGVSLYFHEDDMYMQALPRKQI